MPPASNHPAPVVSSAGRERRRELLRVAIDVFGEAGFAGARIDDVADRVGIRRPSVLYHFPDKATLYRAAIARVIEEIAERVDATEDHPGDRLEAIGDAWIDFVIDRPHAARLLLRQLIDEAPGESTALAAPLVSGLFSSIQAAIDERTGPEVGKRIDASEFSLILSSTSLVWVAGRGAVEGLLGLDTLSPDAVRRHRRMLHTLIRQLLSAARSMEPEPPPAASKISTRSKTPLESHSTSTP